MDKLFLAVFSLIVLNSCTYSINIIHTQGKADDVVDEQQEATPNISPNVNIPLTPSLR